MTRRYIAVSVSKSDPQDFEIYYKEANGEVVYMDSIQDSLGLMWLPFHISNLRLDKSRTVSTKPSIINGYLMMKELLK